MEKKRWDCTALPKGWKMEEVTRKSGLSAGKSDVYYFRYYTNEGLQTLVGAQNSEFADGKRQEYKKGNSCRYKVWGGGGVTLCL